MAQQQTDVNPFEGLLALNDGDAEENQRLRSDFEYFFENLWLDNSGRPVLIQPFQRPVFEALKKQSHILVNVFRGSGKSSLLTIAYVCWRIGNNRDLRVIIACKNESLVRDFLTTIEQFMRSDGYRAVFGDVVPPPRTLRWNDTEKIVLGRSKHATGLTLLGLGVEATVAGRRADLIVCDDIATEKNSETAIQRAHLSTWFFEQLEPVLEPGGQFIVNATPYARADINSEIASSWGKRFSEQFVHFKIPGIRKLDREPLEDEVAAQRETDGAYYVSEWEERRPIVEMISWWEDKPLQFCNQILVDPIDTSLAFLQLSWLEQNLIAEADVPPLEEMTVYFGIDPGWTEGRTSDYSVICVGAKHQATNLVYVLDVIRERCDPERLWDMTIRAAARWRPVLINMESNGAQTFLSRTLQDRTFLNIRPHRTKSISKTQRFSDMSVYFTTRRVKLAANRHEDVLQPIAALDPLFYEWMTFRGEKSVEHDDCLDALDIMLHVAAYGEEAAEGSYAVSRPTGRDTVIELPACAACGAEADNLRRVRTRLLCSDCHLQIARQDPRGLAHESLRRYMLTH